MSHDEKGRILAGGTGTITIGPDASTKIYPHQGRYITATVKVKSPDTIPANATIDFSQSTSGKSSGFKTLYGEPQITSVPIVVDPLDNTQGVAKLCIAYDTSAGSNQIVVNAQAGTGWTGPKPADAATATYTVLANDPTIICAGASKTVLPIPTAADGDQITPATDKYTTAFTCTVTDGANPIPGYVVEWHEAATKSHGLFSFLVNAYTSDTAAYTDRLPSTDAVFIQDTEQQGYFIRMTTDSSGTAALYLVAKHSAGAIGQGIIARYDFGATFEYTRPFLIVNTDDAAQNLENLYPRIDEVMDQDTLNYDQLRSPPYVSIIIPNDPDAAPQDNIYLIVNGAIAAGPYHANGKDLSSQVLASLCYSESVQGGMKSNEVLFVVGSVQKGHSYASATRGFYGKGNNMQLQGGTLAAAELYPYEGYINSTTLSQGWVAIKIELDQSQKYGWKANVGDTITGTAVLTGYEPSSDVLRQPQIVSANALPPITANDLSNGSVLLKFPATPFEGWDSELDPPQTEGQCCIVYTVQSGGQTQSSQVLSVTLNTADMSFARRR